MAELKLKIVTAGPGAPKVVSDDLNYLTPGDRLTFQSDDGKDVFVKAGGILLSLVKLAGAGAKTGNFIVNAIPDGAGGTAGYTVDLIAPGGGSPDPDPPN